MHTRTTGEPALDTLLAQLDAAASALDVDGFLRLFVDGPDALFAVDGQILEGMPAIRAMHRAGWAQLKSVAFRTVPVSVVKFGDDGRRVPVTEGQGACFARVELHAKGSDTGMTALMDRVDDLALDENNAAWLRASPTASGSRSRPAH
jgi:hypothetical protein